MPAFRTPAGFIWLSPPRFDGSHLFLPLPGKGEAAVSLFVSPWLVSSLFGIPLIALQPDDLIFSFSRENVLLLLESMRVGKTPSMQSLNESIWSWTSVFVKERLFHASVKVWTHVVLTERAPLLGHFLPWQHMDASFFPSSPMRLWKALHSVLVFQPLLLDSQILLGGK